MKKILTEIKKAFLVTMVLLLICGIGYPLLLTGMSQVLFPGKANGSLVMVGDQPIGSELVGQEFTDARFMKGRPSAVNYNTYTQEEKENGTYTGISSGSNNYGPTSQALTDRVKIDMAAFIEANPSIQAQAIPTDLLTASGSGLDPHISPASAAVQIPALVETTGLPAKTLETIVAQNTQGKAIGIFGEEVVNVLKVNIEIAKELGLL